MTSRISRRRLTIAVVVLALIATACDDSSPDPGTEPTSTTAGASTATTADVTTTSVTVPPPTTEPPAKRHGGSVIASVVDEPETLNRFVPGGVDPMVRIIGNAFGRGVYRIDGATLELEPDLVVDLPTVDNGGVTIADDGTMRVAYEILDGAVWSDGVPITGADFQFTLDAIRNPANAVVFDIDGLEDTYGAIVDSEFTDTTFAFTMNAPTIHHELLFEEIIPKHAVERTDFLRDWNETRWPSNGPFVFDEWSEGEFIRLVRNPNYFKSDPETGLPLPFLDEVVFRFVGNNERALDVFTSRETDVVNPTSDLVSLDRLAELAPEGAQVDVRNSDVWEQLGFQFSAENDNRESFNTNLSFRRAIAHAIDRDGLAEDVAGRADAAASSFVEIGAPTLAGEGWGRYPYDPQRAIELLEQACVEIGRDCAANPVEIELTASSSDPTRASILRDIAQDLTAIGIDVDARLQEEAEFFGATVVGGSGDVMEWAWRSAPGRSGAVAFLDKVDPIQPGPAGENWYRWGVDGSVTADAVSLSLALLLAEVRTSADTADLDALLAEIETLLAEQVVFVPLYARQSVAAIWSDEVGGFAHNPSRQGYTWNIGEWHRLDI